MDNKKTLSLNGFTIPHTFYIVVSILMVATSIYLTKHFYETYFPSGIGSATSLCGGSGFWGCNKATESALGHILYVPTSFFGIIIGLMGIIGAVFPSEKMERTNKFFILLNALGCLVLLAYSLIALGGLCQFCTLYYALSFTAAFLFFKHSSLKPIPDWMIAGIYGLMVVIPGFFMHNYFTKEMAKQSSLTSQYTKQFAQLRNMGEPSYISPYMINRATDEWEDAPVRIAVFSDFQCPFCKNVADQIPELIRGLEDKVNVGYYFFPLDNACNPEMTRSFHQYACKAAYLSACDPEKFVEVHDAIFERQTQLNDENLNKWAKEFGLNNCFDNSELQDVVRQTLNVGKDYGLKSTPTLIINGKKIEGSIPTVYLRAIIESLL